MKARIPGAAKGGQANMMKKIQQMQDDMAASQAQVEESEFSATAGGGAVEVTVNGKNEVLRINMKPEIVDPEDIEMLQDLLIAAINEAIRKATEVMEQEMSQITGGLNLGSMGLGF